MHVSTAGVQFVAYMKRLRGATVLCIVATSEKCTACLSGLYYYADIRSVLCVCTALETGCLSPPTCKVDWYTKGKSDEASDKVRHCTHLHGDIWPPFPHAW